MSTSRIWFSEYNLNFDFDSINGSNFKIQKIGSNGFFLKISKYAVKNCFYLLNSYAFFCFISNQL